MSTNEPMQTTLVRARVERSRARNVEKILSRLGLKPSDAVNMLYAQIIQRRAIPFAVSDAGDDYARDEYGATAAELTSSVRRANRDIARERKAGTIRRVTSANDLR
jgi:addiction module RelB/DinJ family antitoxin